MYAKKFHIPDFHSISLYISFFAAMIQAHSRVNQFCGKVPIHREIFD